MVTIEQLRQEEARLQHLLSTVRENIRKVESPKLGKLPNKRAGFHHTHSNSYECGMAYWENAGDYDYPDKGAYWPCKRLVNHEGRCGYEDNSAY